MSDRFKVVLEQCEQVSAPLALIYDNECGGIVIDYVENNGRGGEDPIPYLFDTMEDAWRFIEEHEEELREHVKEFGVDVSSCFSANKKESEQEYQECIVDEFELLK